MRRGFQDVHLEIHSTVASIDIVQAVVEQIGKRLGLDGDALHWTAMAVRETVINAITHGNRSDPSKLVHIHFSATPEIDPTTLIVSVRDEGEGFDPSAIADPLSPENMLKASGRGIFLIRQFMDEVSMERSGKGGMEVRMLKRIRSA